jgi:nitrate/nitrite transport system substrate-binding protein
MRTDLYEEAMREVDYKHGGRDDSPETLFDGTKFDPKDAETYAMSFGVKSAKG